MCCTPSARSQAPYLGFDKNEYPGDARLAALHRSFAFTSYWLNTPPGAAGDSWAGKRTILKASGFGFLILFNGRLDAQLKGRDAAALGRADAGEAMAAAEKEGFGKDAIVFLDQEEGGRLLPEQNAYLFAWTEAIRASKYRPGVYCSGILVPDGTTEMSTAIDIENHEKGRELALWVANDACPPAPGCVLTKRPPSMSGVKGTLVWQYAQSPKTRYARSCGGYARDGQCYAPGASGIFLDLDVATSPDPSHGR